MQLQAIQERMKAAGLTVLVIPSADPHQSEYVAPYWKARTFLTGFTGSAGTALVTLEEGYLWTDGRYFIQAEKEIEGSGFQLMKMGIPGYPTLTQWLEQHVETGDCIGFDGRVVALDTFGEWQAVLEGKEVEFCYEEDWIDVLWPDRPALSTASIFDLKTEFAGASRVEKMAAVREKMDKDCLDVYVISSLDDIAWLTNLRGGDVEHTPVFASFFTLSQEGATLYVDPAKVPDEIADRMADDGIVIQPYPIFYQELGKLQGRVGLDGRRSSVLAASSLGETVQLISIQEITTRLKAIKNEVELSNLRNCQVEDGAAMVRGIKRIREAINSDQAITELDVDRILIEERSKSDMFLEPSFHTIAAYKSNAAMMHYRATKRNHAIIEPRGLLLIDSGGQYYTGTTDITRTLAMGDLSQEVKRDYTLVLKGMIQLTLAKFLMGTSGKQLDTIARGPLWKEGLDYKCGTGHGVGYLLGVHEGPQNFSNHKPGADTPLLPGMVITNEPGVYKEGKHGIRTENMLVVDWETETSDGRFYGFETITLCPIDTRAIEISMLTGSELDWLNTYHERVYSLLSPVLTEGEKVFLQGETARI